MLCNYGCGREAKYQFKNGKWCCSKNFRMCPHMRYKGLPDYKKINKKVVCEYCKKLISYTSIKRHKRACYLNPKNIRKCKNCEKIVKNNNIFCSKKCSASYNNKKRKHSSKTKEKIRVSVILSCRTRINNPKTKNIPRIPKLKRKCIRCGISHKNEKFCSHRCFGKFRKDNPDYKKELNSKYERYKLDCMFTFNVYDYPDKFDLDLINKHGWYKAKNRGNNLNGISIDHMISITDGFKNKIPSELIRHPANCKLMQHSENNKKNTDSSITLKELKHRIKNFSNMGPVTQPGREYRVFNPVNL